jgi:hypothetical protein
MRYRRGATPMTSPGMPLVRIPQTYLRRSYSEYFLPFNIHLLSLRDTNGWTGGWEAEVGVGGGGPTRRSRVLKRCRSPTRAA